MPAADAFGGPLEAIDIGRSVHRLEPLAATFHGRDIFAPVAAHLAAGAPFGAAGDPLDVADLTPLPLPSPVVGQGRIEAHALAIDGFGNVQLDVSHAQLAGSGLKMGRPVRVQGEPAQFARTFADVGAGELLLYEDAYRTLALAVNRGSAAERLGLHTDDTVVLEPA
jgi:S-adenosylmethionine hydrolase